jgi:hypothetical protein
MTTPAFGPVDGANPGAAAANIAVFVAEVRKQAALSGEARGDAPTVGEPVRDESLDDGGRFGWVLDVNGVRVRVLMPGVDLAVVRSLADHAPGLQVNGEWAWWAGAVMAALPITHRK